MLPHTNCLTQCRVSGNKKKKDNLGKLLNFWLVSVVEWSGVEWSGVEWSGVEWSGVEWSGVEWRGEENKINPLIRLKFNIPYITFT